MLLNFFLSELADFFYVFVILPIFISLLGWLHLSPPHWDQWAPKHPDQKPRVLISFCGDGMGHYINLVEVLRCLREHNTKIKVITARSSLTEHLAKSNPEFELYESPLHIPYNNGAASTLFYGIKMIFQRYNLTRGNLFIQNVMDRFQPDIFLDLWDCHTAAYYNHLDLYHLWDEKRCKFAIGATQLCFTDDEIYRAGCDMGVLMRSFMSRYEQNPMYQIAFSSWNEDITAKDTWEAVKTILHDDGSGRRKKIWIPLPCTLIQPRKVRKQRKILFYRTGAIDPKMYEEMEQWAQENNVDINCTGSLDPNGHEDSRYKRLHFITLKGNRDESYFTFMTEHSMIISSAGNLMLTEAMKLNIPVLAIPIVNHTEQHLNAMRWVRYNHPLIKVIWEFDIWELDHFWKRTVDSDRG